MEEAHPFLVQTLACHVETDLKKALGGGLPMVGGSHCAIAGLASGLNDKVRAEPSQHCEPLSAERGKLIEPGAT